MTGEFCGVGEGGAKVVMTNCRIALENIGFFDTGGEVIEDHRDHYARTAYARFSMADFRICLDVITPIHNKHP